MKFLISLLFFVFSHNAMAQTPDQIKTLRMGSHFFTYLANQADLEKPNPQITTAVIVLHGSMLNTFTYFSSIVMVADKLGKTKETLVLAPSFKTKITLPPSRQELSWTDEGWLRGDESDQNPTLSSFDVIDALISKIANPLLYPHLKSIVLTGHSAGGQLTQRYALSSTLDSRLPGIHLRYLVLNPGSYTYLNERRPVPPKRGCRMFNDYKYGLNDLNAYFKRTPLQSLVTSYLQKEVVYFLGEADTDEPSIDQSCEAQSQGRYRLQRGKFFKTYLDQEFPGHAHQIVTAPGVIHSQRAMYVSPQGIKLLFPN